MRPLRSRWVRGLVIWTLAMLVVATVLAVGAMVSLYEGEQACFVDFPSVPCPDAQDSRLGLLAFAFLGVPLIWLAGVGVALVGRSAMKRRRARPPSPHGES